MKSLATVSVALIALTIALTTTLWIGLLHKTLELQDRVQSLERNLMQSSECQLEERVKTLESRP